MDAAGSAALSGAAMSTSNPDDQDDRRRRLAEALRTNLRRRKAQARARAEGGQENRGADAEPDRQEG
jgi:hypothetical protein